MAPFKRLSVNIQFPRKLPQPFIQKNKQFVSGCAVFYTVLNTNVNG